MEFDIARFLLLLFPLIMGITLHEAAHAWMAHKLGDNTAFMLGRVTLSPIKHIDPIGTIAVPVALWLLSGGTFTFGWARPVPFNTRNLKNIRNDIRLIAFAGPLSNIIMAVLWGAVLALLVKLHQYGMIDIYPEQQSIISGLYLMSLYGLWINLILALLNLIPIPPLDGGKIAVCSLPHRQSQLLASVEPYGIFILITLIYTNLLDIGGLANQILRIFFSILDK